MSSKDRHSYETATTLDQTFLDNCHDNLTNDLRLVVDIETPTGTIYASDRNMYKGSQFYEALLTFPRIDRTVGDFLSGVLEFGSLELEISNVDQRFNDFLPGGADHDGWIGKSVIIRLGLREVSATYTAIFSGFVTEVGGIGRTLQSIRIICRDKFDSVNKEFPVTSILIADYPNVESEYEGKGIPVIYGDWTTKVNPQSASVPAYPVNGDDPNVNGETSRINNVELLISSNINSYFDTSKVYLYRGSEYFLIDSADITGVVNNNFFEIEQDTGNTLIDTDNYVYEKGDVYLVMVKGVDLGTYDDNAVEIARDILKTYGGLIDADFHSDWTGYYRIKNSPAQSAIANIKCRLWIQEARPAIEVALSLLEQVRLEGFVDRDLLFNINTLHFEDFPDPSIITFEVQNWDVVKDTLKPEIDIRNNFNRAKATYNYWPDQNEDAYDTKFYSNAAAITQAGKDISKIIVYPNLYIQSDVINQLTETLRLTSSYIEVVKCELTWRALIHDIRNFVKLNVSIGSIVYDNVPAMIRKIGYNPTGITIPVEMWAMQLTPYPTYTPAYSGTVGGYNSTIA